MLWRCFAAGGTGALHKIDGIMRKGNYVDILKQHLKTSVRKLKLVCVCVCVCVCVGKDSPGSESDGGESRSDSGEIQPKKVRGFGFGDIFKDQPIRLRPASGDMDTEGEKVMHTHKLKGIVQAESIF
ncbi:unnamed protein product, partial [Oncorhynchus mykiss]